MAKKFLKMKTIAFILVLLLCVSIVPVSATKIDLVDREDFVVDVQLTVYNVYHAYYTDGSLDGSVSDGYVTDDGYTEMHVIAANTSKRTQYNGNTYSYSSYQVDTAGKCLTLIYTRQEIIPTQPQPDPVTEPTVEPTTQPATQPVTEPEPTEPAPKPTEIPAKPDPIAAQPSEAPTEPPTEAEVIPEQPTEPDSQEEITEAQVPLAQPPEAEPPQAAQPAEMPIVTPAPEPPGNQWFLPATVLMAVLVVTGIALVVFSLRKNNRK